MYLSFHRILKGYKDRDEKKLFELTIFLCVNTLFEFTFSMKRKSLYTVCLKNNIFTLRKTKKTFTEAMTGNQLM